MENCNFLCHRYLVKIAQNPSISAMLHGDGIGKACFYCVFGIRKNSSFMFQLLQQSMLMQPWLPENSIGSSRSSICSKIPTATISIHKSSTMSSGIVRVAGILLHVAAHFMPLESAARICEYSPRSQPNYICKGIKTTIRNGISPIMVME